MNKHTFINKGTECSHANEIVYKNGLIIHKNLIENMYHKDHSHEYWEFKCKICGNEWEEKW